MSELPNPFDGITSAGIDADGPIAFMVDYGWNDEETLEDQLKTNEKLMLQEMWDVAQAQGRMLGQMEAGAAATERVKEKQARIEELETALARAEDDAKGKAEEFWKIRYEKVQELLEIERSRCENAVTVLEATSKRVEELRSQLEAERAERKIGFRIWWRLDRLAASAGQVTHSKLASYTDD